MKNETPGVGLDLLGHSKRRWLFASAAGLAALGGAVWSWSRLRSGLSQDLADIGFWQLRFSTPSGGERAMLDFKGKPLLLNFWATWCPPCIEELPLLDAFYTQNAAKGWQVLGIAVDKPSAVREFLNRLPLSFPVVMAGSNGSDLSKTMGNSGGGLPFTVVIDGKGGIAQRKMGKVSQADLGQWSELK